MKNIKTFILLVLATLSAQSQMLTNAGINSISGVYSNANNSLSFSVGQTVIGNYAVANSMLTNGTLQPESFAATLPQGSFLASQCGYINNVPSGNIKCVAVVGAIGYVARFYPVGSNVVYAQKNVTSTTITFTGLTPALQSGTQYDVTVTPILVGGAFGIESAKCRMGLIAIPTPATVAPTSLTTNQCRSTQPTALNVLNTSTLLCTNVSQASTYQFKFVNVANAGNTIIAYASYVNQRSLAPLGLTPGATYAVSVRATVLGVQAANFGSVCYIKIIQSSSAAADKVQSEDIAQLSIINYQLSINLFPNPIIDDATILISSSVSEKVNVTITDMMGKVVFNDKLATNTNYQLSIINYQLKRGVYFVNVVNATENKVVRLVKQ